MTLYNTPGAIPLTLGNRAVLYIVYKCNEPQHSNIQQKSSAITLILGSKAVLYLDLNAMNHNSVNERNINTFTN